MKSETMLKWLLAAVAAGALALTGCAGPETEAPHAAGHAEDVAVPTSGIVNDNCPIMGGDVDPAVDTVTWQGHRVGFCCPGCEEKWAAWSDAKKSAFVAESKSD